MIDKIFSTLKAKLDAGTIRLETLRSQPDFRPIRPIPILPNGRSTLLVVGFWIIVVAMGILGWRLVTGR